VKCRKCGAELHPEQKVCIQCGERTAAGGKFDVEEERAWRPSARMVQIAGGVLVLLIVVLILYRALHVVPPEVVAEDWFDAMLSRNFSKARTCVTPKFDEDLSARMMDMRALAEMWIMEINDTGATPQVGAPVYDGTTNPRRAWVTITLRSQTGETAREIKLTMAKVGRRWKVDQAL